LHRIIKNKALNHLDAYDGEKIATNISYISLPVASLPGTVFIVEFPLNSQDMRNIAWE
jgi:hypothetical protein